MDTNSTPLPTTAQQPVVARATPPSIAKLAEALAKAQAELKNATLNKVNPHFKSKYADLAAIRDATAPTLAKHGLSIVQTTAMEGGSFILRTQLLHVSGESIESVYPLPMNVDRPQIVGSALTYARRYSWSAICAISSEEDDGGNAAEKEGAKNERISDEQKERLVMLLQDTDSDTKAFLSIFKVESIDVLPASDFKRAESMLLKKAAKLDAEQKGGDA